jgi:hypothetical protein
MTEPRSFVLYLACAKSRLKFIQLASGVQLKPCLRQVREANKDQVMPKNWLNGKLSNAGNTRPDDDARMAPPPASKYDRLMAVFEEFFETLSCIPIEKLGVLGTMWPGAKASYVARLARGGSKSAIAAGLEQGARELPMLIGSLDLEYRAFAMQALSKALLSHYPDFASKNAQRLAAVLSKGIIRTESQFFLVHHRIDELEGVGGSEVQLAELYRLAENFEARQHKR